MNIGDVGYHNKICIERKIIDILNETNPTDWDTKLLGNGVILFTNHTIDTRIQYRSSSGECKIIYKDIDIFESNINPQFKQSLENLLSSNNIDIIEEFLNIEVGGESSYEGK